MGSQIPGVGADKIERLYDNYDGEKVILRAIGGGVRKLYMKDDTNLLTAVLRTDPVSIVTTGLIGNVFTVADGTIFRKGEIVPTEDSSSVQKGSVVITDITGNDLTFSKIVEFNAVSGDILVLRADGVLSEDDAEVIDTGNTPYAIFSMDSSVLLNVDLGSIVKKKF